MGLKVYIGEAQLLTLKDITDARQKLEPHSDID